MNIKDKNKELKQNDIHINRTNGFGNDNYYYSNNSGLSYSEREHAINNEYKILKESKK